MHPVRTYRYNPAQNVCTHTATGETEGLEYTAATSSGFSYCAVFGKARGPKLWCRDHVLPTLGIEISRFGYREAYRPERSFDYYVDIVSVPEQGEFWTVRDFYLDVLVYDGERVEILDTDEYLAAIAEGHLTAEEAAHALTALHTFTNDLARHEYNLDAYLQSEGVTLSWRKLKSTR